MKTKRLPTPKLYELLETRMNLDHFCVASCLVSMQQTPTNTQNFGSDGK